MRQIGTVGAMALCALLASTAQTASARQAQVQSQQQTQQAQQARQQAEAYLRREEAAATGRQSQRTDRANQDAAVPDEAAGHTDAARPARTTNPSAASGSSSSSGTSGNSGNSGNSGGGTGARPPPSYGPVLNPRQPQSADPARKDPAEVHDETDRLMREAPPPSDKSQPKQQKQAKQTPRRHPAWQAAGPLAPRPLSGGDAPAIGYGALTIPPPAQAPQPVVPSTTPLQSCVGGACRDAAGGTYNLGPTGTGVSSSGRLCSSNGSTVQCF